MTCRGKRVRAGALLLTLIAPLAAGDSIAIRDQNPLIRGLYLPVPGLHPSEVGGVLQRFVLTLSNTTNIETASGELLYVDGESLELRWLLAWQPLEHVQVRLTVPVVHYGGGILDGLVDEWHEFLGVSGGRRPAVAGDNLVYGYQVPAGTVLETDGGTALGDSALEAGFQFRTTPRTHLSAWVGVEAPTGDSARLSGNEAWDYGLWLEGRSSLSERLSIEARLGAVKPGSVAPLSLEPRDWVAFAGLGTTWEIAPSFDLCLQLDAHDGMFDDTEMRFLGEALLLTVGAEYRSPGGWRWQLALAEDLRVDASPDFAIQFGLHIGTGAR